LPTLSSPASPGNQERNTEKWLKHVSHYLSRTKQAGLKLRGLVDPSLSLKIFCNADFAGNLDTRKSTSGLAVFFYGSLVYHQAKKQTRIATSTVEAKINGCINAWEQGAIRISRMLMGLTIEIPQPIPIYTDFNSIFTKLEAKKKRYHNKQYDISIKVLIKLEELQEVKFH
jgi:hypothetical protein